MKKMTRNEAADFLGVEPQTTTNWANKGLLGGYNDTVSKRFYVNADDVYKLAEKYKLMAVTEDALNSAIFKMKEEGKKINAKLERLMKATIDLSTFKGKEVDDLFLFFIVNFLQPQSHRRAYALRKFMLGWKIKEIARSLDLTEGRTRTLIVEGLRILINKLNEYKKLSEENESLKSTIALKNEEIEKIKDKLILRIGKMKEQDEKIEENSSFELPKIFKKNLIDFNLSVRTLNCFRAEKIYTIGDLVTLSREKLLGLRNMGRKSVSEIEDFLDSLNLQLNMPIASVYASGLKKIGEETENSNIIKQKIFETATCFKEKYNLEMKAAMEKALYELKKYIQ